MLQGLTMKKKVICILVVIMLLVSVIGLTACNLFGNSGDDTTQTEQTPNEANKLDSNTPSDGQDAPKLSYLYKFEVSALQFAEMMYPNPNVDENTDSGDLGVIYEEYLLSLQQYQLYVNEMNAVYEGSTFAFYDNNTATLTYADGTTQNYEYHIVKQYDFTNKVYNYYLYIGSQNNPDLVAALDENMLLFSTQMDDDGLFYMYLQFVVSK